MSNTFDNPYYTHPCSEVLEDHARHIILHQYTCCIKVESQWAVPVNEAGVWLSVPAVVDMLPGSCLWHPDYGYFKIMIFDRQAQKVLVQRKDVEGTVEPGTTIPSCTKFIITPDV